MLSYLAFASMFLLGFIGHSLSGRAFRYNLLRKAKGFPLQSLMQKEAVFVPHL
jgi:hypothetical protein